MLQQNSQLLQLIHDSNITGVLIDLTAMEAAGGGYFPSYLIENGHVIRMLCPDIGNDAYSLLEVPKDQIHDNTWSFYMGDQGWELVNLKTDQVFNLQSFTEELVGATM